MTTPSNAPIRVGVSSCLLGEHVRYDGGHKHDRYITDTLGRFFSFLPVCPEQAPRRWRYRRAVPERRARGLPRADSFPSALPQLSG